MYFYEMVYVYENAVKKLILYNPSDRIIGPASHERGPSSSQRRAGGLNRYGRNGEGNGQNTEFSLIDELCMQAVSNLYVTSVIKILLFC